MAAHILGVALCLLSFLQTPILTPLPRPILVPPPPSLLHESILITAALNAVIKECWLCVEQMQNAK